MSSLANMACPRWSVDSWQRPITGVGGDFWIARRDADTLRVFIGDVTGHDARASQIAAHAKTLIKRDLNADITPLTMYRWNDAIRALDDERFIAFTILELRESTSLLRIAPAGNPHPIVFRGPTGAAIEIASHGMPLGLLDREEWRPPTWQELTLTPDAAVICVTDGISDTRVRHSPDRFGLSGILAAFQNQPEHNATRLRQEFLDRTDNARLQEDDITVVSIERLPRIAA